MNDLIANIDKLHTTEMGAIRIIRNLFLTTSDLGAWCKDKILDERTVIERKGKNWYATVDGCKITVNSFTIALLRYIKIKEKL